jgi:S1-C subfamily serine protease
MAEHWAFPSELQPSPDETPFDLGAVLDSVLLLHAEIPEDGFTASILGTERIGNGIVIGEDGIVLTIGYLITEAQTIWLTTNAGAVIPAYPIAYDFVTGLGLVQPLSPLAIPPMERGTAARVSVGSDVLVVGHGGRSHALKAKITDSREFAGYWEYVLDQALFTAPAHPQWGGAALVGTDGKLLGVGSLLVQESRDGKGGEGDENFQGNMFVPIDLLEPILNDLLTQGRAARSARPWLGMYTSEVSGQLMVGGIVRNGPAEQAGIRQGDVVLEVAGERVTSLATLFRKIWQLGPAGTEIPLALARESSLLRVRVHSADRGDYLKKPKLH